MFPDSFGVLEGEQLVRGSSTKYVRHCEQPTMYHNSGLRSQSNHTYLRPIVTQLANPSSDGTFEDWTILSRPASNSIDVHIYGLWVSPRFNGSLVCSFASCLSETANKLLCRTYLHHRQLPCYLNTGCYTRLSTHSRTIYSSAYSTTTDCLTKMIGISDSSGASSLTFVGDGATSHTHRHSTWLCKFDAGMAPL
jgi:hypothetical protein